MAEKQRVVRTDQAPLNPKRWCLTLSCGHEVWITRARRPSRKFFLCRDCADILITFTGTEGETDG